MKEKSKKSLSPGKRLYTIKEAAEYLGHSVWGVRTLIWSRILPVVQYGRKQWLDIEDLNAFIESNKHEVA